MEKQLTSAIILWIILCAEFQNAAGGGKMAKLTKHCSGNLCRDDQGSSSDDADAPEISNRIDISNIPNNADTKIPGQNASSIPNENEILYVPDASSSNQVATSKILNGTIIVMGEPENNTDRWSDNFADIVGVYAIQARRPYMEDRYCIQVKHGFMAFGVFDGHGGAAMADYAAKNLLSLIIDALENEPPTSNITNIISAVIIQFNIDARRVLTRGPYGRYPGSTLVLGVVHRETVYIANVGDSRAVGVHSKGRYSEITKDHKANDVQERERIHSLGGFVLNVGGVWRVAGDVAVSRSLGDYHVKRDGMTAEPDIFVVDLVTSTAEYVVLATDGVWDVLSSRRAAATIANHAKSEKLFGAKQLAERAVRRSDHDNVTVMVVKLDAIRALLMRVACEMREC